MRRICQVQYFGSKRAQAIYCLLCGGDGAGEQRRNVMEVFVGKIAEKAFGIVALLVICAIKDSVNKDSEPFATYLRNHNRVHNRPLRGGLLPVQPAWPNSRESSQDIFVTPEVQQSQRTSMPERKPHSKPGRKLSIDTGAGRTLRKNSSSPAS
jgi:hypothetical protein